MSARKINAIASRRFRFLELLTFTRAVAAGSKSLARMPPHMLASGSESVSYRKLDLIRIPTLLQYSEVLVNRVDVLPRRLVEPGHIQQRDPLHDRILVRDPDWQRVFGTPVPVEQVREVVHVDATFC